MGDLAVSVGATLGRALLADGQVGEALEATSRAVQGLGSGVDFAYQVAFAHSLVLDKAGQPDEGARYLELAYTKLQSMLAGLSDDQRAIALRNVPGHREIVERWLERRPQQIEVRIAAADAPSGRALEDHELVTVTWTVSEPSDNTLTDAPKRRRKRLIRLLTEAAEQGGSPTVSDLADALGVGAATVRRDLAALRAAGRHVATRGTRVARQP
jgi:hypothetical protein